MQFYLITPISVVILTLALLGGTRRLLLLVAATIPFGMLAVVSLPSLGGLSLLGVNIAAATLVAVGCIALVSRLLRGERIWIEPASFALLFFAAYSVFSAIVLVRLFAGQTMVFALSRGVTGVKVSALFSWEKVWLAPSSANISQTFYIVLACGFFIAALYVLAQYGTSLAVQCITLAGTVNVVLGLLDLAAFDALLAPVRTANYSLANTASVSSISRVIGGFSEASSFGAAGAMFFGWSASAYSRTGRLRDAVLAFGNGVFAVLALSSTGIVALTVVSAALLPRLWPRRSARVGRSRLLLTAVAIAILAMVAGVTMTMTRAPEVAISVVNDLILSKAGSSSGLERTAWAVGGLTALRDTWGLGAGAGSLRSNGLLFVLLGSVGIPGTIAFAMFVGLAFGGRAVPGQKAILSNARMAALAVLVSMILAATVPDPGITLTFLAAVAVSTRRRQPSSQSPRPTSMSMEGQQL